MKSKKRDKIHKILPIRLISVIFFLKKKKIPIWIIQIITHFQVNFDKFSDFPDILCYIQISTLYLYCKQTILSLLALLQFVP